MSEVTQISQDQLNAAVAAYFNESGDVEETLKALHDRELPKEYAEKIEAQNAKLDAIYKALQKEPPEEVGGNVEGEEGETAEKSFTDFLRCVRYQNKSRLAKVYGSEFVKWDAQKDFGWATKDLIEGSGTAGGYLVPTDQRSNLMDVDVGINPVVRPRADVIRTSRASVTVPTLDQSDTPSADKYLDYEGGVQAYWTEEAGSKTETEPDFNQLELKVHKLAGYTQASDELVSDSTPAIAGVLTNLFGRAIQRREDYAFLRGTGVGQPLGVLNCGCLITVERDDDNEIHLVDLANMLVNFMPSSLYGNSVWVANITTLPQFIQLADASNQVIWIPNARDRLPLTVFGMPIIFVDSRLPTLGTTGDLLLADFDWYYVLDNGQTEIQSSIHYAFTQDLTTWRFVHRVDGQCKLRAPIYIDTTNQVSPFVALHADTT